MGSVAPVPLSSQTLSPLHTSGCSAAPGLQLAAKSEAKHPEDAIPIYQRQVERSLARKNNDAYAEAVGLLRKIHGLMARTGGHDAFASYLASVRTAHKPKRNFIKLRDSTKWGRAGDGTLCLRHDDRLR